MDKNSSQSGEPDSHHNEIDEVYEFEEIKVINVEDADDVVSMKAKTLEKQARQEGGLEQIKKQQVNSISLKNSIQISLSEAQIIQDELNDQYKEISDRGASGNQKMSRGVKKTIEDFELHQVLGEGSYGKVYCALEKNENKAYAIKVLDKYHIMKNQKVDSVFRERDILRELSHPSIIKQYYTFQDDINLYYVFEYASRGSLTKLLSQVNISEKIPLELVRYYAAEILLALEYLNSKNVLHRDLKPENILVTENWHLKIIDFGDSCKLQNGESEIQNGERQNQKRKATFVGTPLYVSPEMLQDNISSFAGDIWAFGCIIYQMITGEVPFKAQHDYQTFQLILNRKMQFPDYMSEDAKDLIDQILKVNPQERLGSGGQSDENGINAIKQHPFFRDFDFQNFQQQPVPLPQSLQASARKQTVIKRQIKAGEKYVEELKRGLLKKRNEYFMQQTRTFILTNEPSLKYYKNESQFRGEVRLSRAVYARRTGRDRFEIVTPGRIYHLKEVKAGDSDQWINAINIAINQHINE
ncbi:3-phosphoinositide-dependent protein kinase 1 [Stylonychia lemnae]|uniref:non-specific serine/threonine protein kinase n=1 Tax=Stylonychia lemnae TaxID=5949 RepID=A0A078ABM0_STYLE|nr:3-phosphoinositide-dependent protein kinase 1 [Stylonychia lemnae]|eukprot:CDW79266.1 3-phosphoinositide-dependent protein kinase 1 [Stylonychia lemnae]